VNENIANALETDNPTYIVNQVESGIIASDPLNDQTLTKEQLLAEGGYWGFGGSAESQGFPVDIFQDSQGLHIGAQSTTPGTWGGVYALSPASDAQVIHAKITAPTNLLPSNWFQTGLYVQSTNGKINYVTCVASVGQWGLSWHLVRTFSDATTPFLYEVLWSDTSLNQPLTRDCTIITDGDTYLQLNLDGVTVYESNVLALDMPAPWIYYLEVETSQDAAMMHGVYSDFYAAKNEFVQLKVAPYIPLTDFGKARIIDDLGNDLSTASFNAAGVANIYISEYSFPMQGKLQILDPLNNVIFTSSATNLAGGDVYSIEFPSAPTNEILPITLVSSGLVVQDMDIQPNTKEELLAMAQPNGFWYYDGSSNEQNIEWKMHRDENGLDLGVKAQSSGFYAGIFQQSQGIDAALFHSKITTAYDTIPSDWFQNGIYVQDGPNELINYIACISITGTEGTVWAVISAKGNMDFITSTETLWIDRRYNQPQTQECTIITNGDDYLKIYMDRELVFETDSHPGLGMEPPFLYFHEPQTSYPGEFLHGKYSDFYATKSENVRVFGLPPTQFGTVKILDQVGNVLESAPVIGNEANILIGKYHFPLAAEIKIFEKNVEIASTLVTQQMYGGDSYVVDTALNDPPIAIDDDVATLFNTPITIDVLSNDLDLEGGSLGSPVIQSGPSFGTAIVNPDGTILYTPITGFSGTDSLVYMITDIDGLTDTAQVTISVNQGINPPGASDDVATTTVNTPITIDVVPNDFDEFGGPLTVIGIFIDPSQGTVVINTDNTITYTPNTGFVGADEFDYIVTNVSGGTDTALVSITVTP